MPATHQDVSNAAQKYMRLAALCDSGFALAVHIRFTRPSLLFQTYPSGWIDHYNEKSYMLVDPTVRWGLTHVGAVEWDSLVDDDTDGVLDAASAYGLANGWTYATGPATSRSLGSMTRTTPFTPDQRNEICAIIDDIHALTEGFDQMPTEIQDAFRAIG